MTYLYAVIAVLLYAAYDAARGLRLASSGRAEVPRLAGAGTDECLIMGGLLRRGPTLEQRAWKEYCADTIPREK